MGTRTAKKNPATIKSFRRGLWLAMGGVALAMANAEGARPIETGALTKCGSLRSYSGSVQIFDASRTQVIDTSPGKALQCGDWISVGEGSRAVVAHKAGVELEASEGTFFQILDAQSGENPDHDHFTVYRGRARLAREDAPSGDRRARTGEIQVATANARARIADGSGVVLYNGEEQKTQLMNVDGKMSLENRFIANRRMAVKPGTMSVVGPNDDRVLPRVPRAVAVKPADRALEATGFSEKSRKEFASVAQEAARTTVPVKLKTAPKRGGVAGETTEGSTGAGMLGSASEAADGAGGDSPGAHAEFASAALGRGAPAARSPASKRAHAGAAARRKPADDGFPAVSNARKDAERARLLNALSRIRPDDDEE